MIFKWTKKKSKFCQAQWCREQRDTLLKKKNSFCWYTQTVHQAEAAQVGYAGCVHNTRWLTRIWWSHTKTSLINYLDMFTVWHLPYDSWITIFNERVSRTSVGIRTTTQSNMREQARIVWTVFTLTALVWLLIGEAHYIKHGTIVNETTTTVVNVL